MRHVPAKASWRIIRRTFSSSQPRATASLLEVQENDGLRTITMKDTKTRNALSLRMMEELIAAVNKNKSDVQLRMIVIRAAEGPVFSAGHNLKELTSDQGISIQRRIFDTCAELMLSIRKAEVPVVAVVNGLAAAAGCQLVSACDFSVASDKSRFSTPGANFGVFCSTPGVSVSRTVNRTMSAFMVMTGLPLTAFEALQAGLIVKVVEENQLERTMLEIHSSIKIKSRPIVKLGKEFFYKQLEMPYESALKEGGEIMVQNLQLKDSQEGLNSFKEKRKPSWSHTDEK